jgi:hypothetical protein
MCRHLQSVAERRTHDHIISFKCWWEGQKTEKINRLVRRIWKNLTDTKGSKTTKNDVSDIKKLFMKVILKKVQGFHTFVQYKN